MYIKFCMRDFGAGCGKRQRRTAKGVKGSNDVTGEGAVCRDHAYRFRRG